jgi:CRISPR system Cascade subunit CasD
MRALVFQLAGPMMAFGDVAVGEHRGVFERPSKSGVLGLVAAALGIDRSDDAAHARLAEGLDFATLLLASGRLLQDYHTVQSASETSLKKRMKAGLVTATRADELDVDTLETIQTRRAYHVGAAHLVALFARKGHAIDLDAMAQALRTPTFVLYLGRKSCPLALPLAPRIIEADDAHNAFAAWRAGKSEAQNRVSRAVHGEASFGIAAEPSLVPAAARKITQRMHRDQPGSRRRRQFFTRPDIWFEEAP